MYMLPNAEGETIFCNNLATKFLFYLQITDYSERSAPNNSQDNVQIEDLGIV